MNRKRDFRYNDSKDLISSYGKRPRNQSREHSPMNFVNDRPMQPLDPGTVNARIYVGELTPEITREVLEDHFSRWGEILGATITKDGFGFVQFKRENDARGCLAAGPEQANIIHGVRIDIKPARTSSTGQGPNTPVGGIRNSRDLIRGSGAYDSPYSEHVGPRVPQNFDRPQRDGSQSKFWDNSESSPYREESSSNLFRGPKPGLSAQTSSFGSMFPSDIPADPSRPNDVEIVVPNKAQRGYAENIETRLKQFDLTIDLLFPPIDITPDRVILDLSSRNCLYAVFATAENEKHNSITLNILHGDPQEHRNMPIEDAMRLIQQNFEEYTKKTRQRSMRDVVPRDIRNLLHDLLEMRPLSMGDLDKMIKYLRERQNALVDNQIEQKRETVGQKNHNAVVTKSMTVMYPGYNVITTSGVPNVTPSIIHPATPASIVPGPPIPNIVTAPSVSMAYTGVGVQTPITGVLNTYGIQQPQMASQSMLTHQFAPPPSQTISAIDSSAKQEQLQARILSLLNNQDNVGPVPPPPAVSSMINAPQRPDLMPQQQHHQSNLWASQMKPDLKKRRSAYNPWTSV